VKHVIDAYAAVKVFSATKQVDRDRLGETVSDWLAAMESKVPKFQVVDTVITQSSDSEFHCLVITIFYSPRVRT